MISVVGMGPGNIRYLTQEAIDVIRTADRRIAFGRIAKTAEQIAKPVIEIQRVQEVLDAIEAGQHNAILASGDACFYGILEYLKSKGVVIDSVSPGLSAFQYMMAKLKRSWSHAALVSLHGSDDQFPIIENHPLSIVLTDHQNTPNRISQKLRESGVSGKMLIGYNLSYDNEWIGESLIGEEIEEKPGISLVVVEHEMD
ncbi:precorrin-6y C5,15-methyltransferase (decarboxylating) subunit CbiE [Deltaproteobacteria bacterium TL4]